MALDFAHRGYEYQDLLSAYFIITEILKGSKAIFKIDNKENENDKFDDFTVQTNSAIIKRQIKYSEGKTLQKSDLSANDYDIALDNLFYSWMEIEKHDSVDIRLCLAWDIPSDIDILQVLIKCDYEDYYGTGKVNYYKINIDKIWREGEQPKSSWSRLRKKASDIDRSEFEQFLDKLIIEVNLPKASLDVSNPGELEQLVMLKIEDLGVGKYPNDNKSVPNVLLMLTHAVKNARARKKVLSTQDIIYQLGIQSNFGSIEQTFHIEQVVNIRNIEKYNSFNEIVDIYKRVVLVGEPGSGKSWFVQNYIDYLQTKSVKVVRHYCYTGVNDTYEIERITVNVFLANLINDILNAFPEMNSIKPTKYGVDISELQVLLNNIPEETLLIIDGLDHIGRIYSLHKETLRGADTQIIKAITNLVFPSHVKVVLVSQPIGEVSILKDMGYKLFDIPRWSDEEITELMHKYSLNNLKLSQDKSLSEILSSKSNGNPLYATYLINEIKNYVTTITIDFIDELPAYSNDLATYYEYLMTKLEENDKVAMILSCSPFYLGETDLKEITGYGNYVKKALLILRSVLSINTCTGGYTIYHESFRRFILDRLKNNEVQIDKVIYSDIINWLSRKGFYNDKRAYNNLLVLFFESGRYDDIIPYINKEFIIQSLFYGNPIGAIKKNYGILVKTSCKLRSYSHLVTCIEISNMLYSMEYSFDENSEMYYESIGYIHGFDHLKELLMYEGKINLNYKDGLKACYLISKNHIIPDWKPYIDIFLKSKDNEKGKELEYFRYFICAKIDRGEGVSDIIKDVADKKYNEYRMVIISEFDRRDNLESINELINMLPNKYWWEKSINKYQGNLKYNFEDFMKCLDEIKRISYFSEKDAVTLSIFVEQIGYFVKSHKDEIYTFIDEIKEKNWFYNWLIFVIKSNEILINSSSQDTDAIEKEVVSIYSWLVKDTNPFKGEPRVCDLYYGDEIICNAIKMPLRFIKSTAAWKQVVEMLSEISSSTTTSLEGCISGPLSTDKLLALLSEVVNEYNHTIIEEMYRKIVECEENHRFYSYLAEYSMRLAILKKKAGKVEEAYDEFQKGIQYLVSYSFRKDRTFSRLLNCINNIYKLDNEVGFNYIKKLKQMADAVVYHTDKNSTQTYPHEWFVDLLGIDLKTSMLFMRSELTESAYYWILEDNLESLLTKCGNNISCKVENILYRTLPVKLDDSLIESYIKNIEVLIAQNEIELARISISELINRFANIGEPYIPKENLAIKIKSMCDKLNVTYNTNIYKLVIKDISDRYSSNNSWVTKYNANIIERKSFDRMTEEELLAYIGKKSIRDTDVNGLILYFEKYSALNNTTKVFFTNLIESISSPRYEDNSQENLITTFESIEAPKEIKSYLFMQMFVRFKDGWGYYFNRTELFIRAFEYEPSVAEECFFNYVYHTFCSVYYSLAVSDKIINSLASINYDKLEILKCWYNLFDVLNFRLSGQCEYNWEVTLKDNYKMDDEELLICILIARLKYGEAIRQKWILSGTEMLLKDIRLKAKFVKPFEWLFDNKEQFMDISLIMVLKLIEENFSRQELIKCGLYSKLKSIYPSSNALCNNLLEGILGINKLRIFIPITYKEYDNRILEMCRYLASIDDRIEKLYTFGVDVFKITEKYFDQIRKKEFRDKYIELIVNKKYSTFIPNIYFDDCLIRYIAEGIEMYLNANAGKDDFDGIANELFNIALFDTKLFIAQQNSVTPRPSKLLKPENLVQGIYEPHIGEWMVIARYEEQLIYKKEYAKTISPENIQKIQAFSGIVFNSDKLRLPYLRLLNDSDVFSEQVYYPDIASWEDELEGIIISNINLNDDIQFTFYQKLFLWLRFEVINILHIKTIYNKNGIIGLNENGEEVLRFSWWQTYYFNDESENYTIPYLSGSQLQIRNDKYYELCAILNKEPKYHVYIIKQ